VIVRPVAIYRHGVEVQILDVDPSITDEQVEYQCQQHGDHSDAVVYSPDCYGPVPPECDARVTTLQELEDQLRTEPEE
jgi:hypothetical protein